MADRDMVLQDHFHPPLSARRHWHAFHNAWATYLASDLNARLPAGYFAKPNVQFGVEIDVATFEEAEQNRSPELMTWNTIPSEWHPPAPTHTVPFELVEETVEISIFNSEAGPVLLGAIELVSPANKDRPEHRKAFVSKCETYLRQGLGVVVVDVVAGRKANLHNELLARLVVTDTLFLPTDLYTTGYRVTRHKQATHLDIWQAALEVGQPLPTMPLWLQGELCLPVDLNTTYERTCREQRIPIDCVNQ